MNAQEIARTRARRHVWRRSPSVFWVRSTGGEYHHVVILLPDGELQCIAQAAGIPHANRCWAARKVAKYLLRNPQRIKEAIA
jgi:hypothetical protein